MSHLALAQNEVERPAAANVGPATSQVVEEQLLVAACVPERVCKHCEAGEVEVPAWQEALLVGFLGERGHVRSQPRGFDGRQGMTGVADDVAEQVSLYLHFVVPLRIYRFPRGT